MTAALSPIDRAKYSAAAFAADYVEDGMRVGLGTGSTAAWLVRRIGARVRDDGLRLTAVPTSVQTAELARAEGIEVTTLDEARWLDLTIDGADEFDRDLNLIKGGGGAHLREKIVATASDRMVVIADASKRVATLGAFPLPVEVIPFGWATTQARVADLLAGMDVLDQRVERRMNAGAPVVTDEGNFLLDLHLRRIGDARALSLALNQIVGVVETGLFLDVCDLAVAGYGDGRVELYDTQGVIEEGRVDLREPDNLFSDLVD